MKTRPTTKRYPQTYLGVAACLALLTSATAHAGPNCTRLGKYFGTSQQFKVNHTRTWTQNDPLFLDANGHHGAGELCAPVAMTHVLGGFADYPNVLTYTAVANAGSASESVAAGTEYQIAQEMGTDDLPLFGAVGYIGSLGTVQMDFTSYFSNALNGSFGAYGSVGELDYPVYYSGFNPSNVDTDTFAEPICASLAEESLPAGNSGYDYSKTQFLLQIGEFSIDSVDIPYGYPCWQNGPAFCTGDDNLVYLVWYDGGHFVPVDGVSFDANGNNEQIFVDNQNPPTGDENGNGSWQSVGQESVSIAGISVFNNAGTVSLSNMNDTNIILGYHMVTVKHGGTCPTGETLVQSGSARGYCEHPGCAPPNNTWLSQYNSCCPTSQVFGNGTYCCAPPANLNNGACQQPCCANSPDTYDCAPTTTGTANYYYTNSQPACTGGQVSVAVYDTATLDPIGPPPSCTQNYTMPMTWLPCACPSGQVDHKGNCVAVPCPGLDSWNGEWGSNKVCTPPTPTCPVGESWNSTIQKCMKTIILPGGV